MKSTGEVMGVRPPAASATPSSRPSSRPASGCPRAAPPSSRCTTATRAPWCRSPAASAELGFRLLATEGTAAYLAAQGLDVGRVKKIHEGRPHVGDLLINGEIALVVNTPLGRASHEDDTHIRRLSLRHGVPCITTLSGALAAVEGIASLRTDALGVTPLQELVGKAGLPLAAPARQSQS